MLIEEACAWAANIDEGDVCRASVGVCSLPSDAASPCSQARQGKLVGEASAVTFHFVWVHQEQFNKPYVEARRSPCCAARRQETARLKTSSALLTVVEHLDQHASRAVPQASM
eukprot:6205478-Pleurochrysis_carterae.AAC.3